MANEAFDRSSWEQRWTHVLRETPDKIDRRPPSSYLRTVAEELKPGTALDAGCGHGSEAIWLAAGGWTVTAVDFSATALELGRSTAEAEGPEVANRIDWVEGDLGVWAPETARYDLVSCLYVHVAGSVVDLVQRLGSGVAPGGTLLLVGHRPVHPVTGEPTPAHGQVQVSVHEAQDALGQDGWEYLVAEELPRHAADTGVDAVIRAVRV